MEYGFIKVAAGAAPVRVADCIYNRAQIADAVMHYEKHGVEVLFFPQLSITAGTCGDLFFQKTLIDSASNSLIYIAQATSKCNVLFFVGLPMYFNGKLYNCMAAVFKGDILGIIPSPHENNCLQYGSRHFSAWNLENTSVNINNKMVPIGTNILFCPQHHSAKIACTFHNNSASVKQTDAAIFGANVIGICACEAESTLAFDLRKNLIATESNRLMCGVAATYSGEGESTTDGVYAGYCQVASCGVTLSDTPLFSRVFAIADIDTDYIFSQRCKHNFPQNKADCEQIAFDFGSKAFCLTQQVDKNPFLPAFRDNIHEYHQRAITICAHSLAKRMAHTNTSRAVIGISGGLDSCLALLTTAKAFSLLKIPFENILAYSMPCFGTSDKTKTNAEMLCSSIGVNLREIDITSSVLSHFKDIGHSELARDITYENAQARMRTLILMDIANKSGGLVIGTGDLSELALGWATYGGDHISMYGVNSGIPKTMIRLIIASIAAKADENFKKALEDILCTPVSPELLPTENGSIAQKTEDIVGPYELHDFFIYYCVHCGFSPKKIFMLAENAFRQDYEKRVIFKWLVNFYNRFFAQQFKRSCMPDGPCVYGISLSPRGGLVMPSDACANIWKEELKNLENEI